MPYGSRVFLPSRGLGYVSNHLPLKVRYIRSRKENLIVTCVGKSFHTYGISHFGLLSVSGLHPEDISCMAADAFHVYTACECKVYAWRRGTELKHTYCGHFKDVHLMLPFGIHLISVDESSMVKVWDIKSEEVFLELKFSNDSFQITTIMHPSTYINKVLFGSVQGSMQLWNFNSSKLVYNFKGWNTSISCLEQAPALDVIGIGLASGRIILYNLKYDETLMEFHQDWGLVTSISFRTDDHPIMATGSVGGHVVFWDLNERRIASQLHAHDSAVTGMQCLAGEPLVVTSSPDNTLKLWVFDMSDGGARLLRIREGHLASPTCIRFHGSNGHNILSSAGDSSLRIFNTQTEQFNKSLGKASYNRKISKKRGRVVLDPLRMPPIMTFTSETTREKEWDNIVATHLGLPMVTTWSYDKLKMGELKLLPERLFKKNRDPDAEVTATCLHLTHCGNFVVIGYSDGYTDRFNVQSGIWRSNYGSPKAHTSAVRGTSTDALNQVVITGGSDAKIKFWKFKDKSSKGIEPLSTLNLKEPISFFRIHGESAMLAVALEDFSVIILDIDTRTIIRHFAGHAAQLTDATFSPDSRWLITCAMDCAIRTWDIPSSQLIDQFKTDNACISISMSPTGNVLATAHVDYLGIFLWCNRTLYSKVTLKALSADDEPPSVALPEVAGEEVYEEEEEESEESEFVSPEQISLELITLSGISSSRWQNLLNIDIIRQRNKPKSPPKAPLSAPFFLPTIQALNTQFDLKTDYAEDVSKLVAPKTLQNLSAFGKELDKSAVTNDFQPSISALKAMGPTMIDFELKLLCPDDGGSIQVMLQFLKLIEHMLTSNRDFELAQAYLGVFLKNNGKVIAAAAELRNHLPLIQNCVSTGWNRIQQKLMYSICVTQNLKTM